MGFKITSEPQHGSLDEFDPDTGAASYVPDDGYYGTDSFSFATTQVDEETGGELASQPATIYLSVTKGPPTADPQTLRRAKTRQRRSP